eukprot:TRINITY_DN11920_c0_g1_i5.p1 TRINITY_DN11920_c0_g1~~TRINITY_DN11920_c0_g1_i5.p1  ORF type:complete len:168 (+),score=5.98 TRINITY_DN11920_c0_g1_i5:495-998(+)
MASTLVTLPQPQLTQSSFLHTNVIMCINFAHVVDCQVILHLFVHYITSLSRKISTQSCILIQILPFLVKMKFSMANMHLGDTSGIHSFAAVPIMFNSTVDHQKIALMFMSYSVFKPSYSYQELDKSHVVRLEGTDKRFLTIEGKEEPKRGTRHGTNLARSKKLKEKA